ncbi:MAG: hypothetical protein KBA15_15250, partial [Spirochaetes bacterium]|nr:hypothetical protein [Spirochaetota bacterium]
KKEVARQKKQEEKRLRRLNKGTAEEAGEGMETDETVDTAAEDFEAGTAEVTEGADAERGDA